MKTAGTLRKSAPREFDARWSAIVGRNAAADGAFVYGVKTTGIFCRPNCHSRLPKPEHVVFFDSPTEAIHSGYRPCKRCQPEGQGWEAEIESRIARACRWLEQAEEKVSLGALARLAGFSQFHFHRLFKARVGVTPKQYQTSCRLNRFRSELRRRNSVGTAIYDAGYESASRAYDGVVRKLGMSPRQYRNGGAGTDIVFGLQRTSLGLALVAATNRGVCAIDFGAGARELRHRLKTQFPEATLHQDATRLGGYFANLAEYLANPQRGLSLPVDLQGTALQCRVWQALQKVPPGQSISYSDLARRVGKPEAVRAVARACAANRIALAVPCHRALRADGSLGGYRWGLGRKRRLLHAEAGCEARD